MRRFTMSFFVCLASLTPSACAPVSNGPPIITLLGDAAFTSARVGWIVRSSSAGYSLFCYQATSPPLVCNRATTSVYVTHDGGHTWRRVLRATAATPAIGPDTLPMTWLHASDGRRALVLSPAARPHGLLYRTTDGGATWAKLTLPRQFRYGSIADIASVGWNDLWLLANLGATMGEDPVRIYRSRDAGGHWVEVACASFPATIAPPSGRCHLASGLVLYGAKTAITFGSRSDGLVTELDNSGLPTISITRDGGVHWQTVAPPLPHGVPAPNPKSGVYPYLTLHRPRFFGPLIVMPAAVQVCRRASVPANYVCANSASLLLSRDGGRTWPASRPLPFTIVQHGLVWDALTSTSWCAINGTTLWTTADAGAHWVAHGIAIPHGFTILRMRFVTRAVGWAIAARVYQPDSVAQATELLRSDDGGWHWSAVSLPAL